MHPTSLHRFGVIADTHDFFDPRLPGIFAGVERILHAGDIVAHDILLELGLIAPVVAVAGNNDFDPSLRETEVIEAGPHRILIHHIFHPPEPSRELAGRIAAVQPRVVITGHTHRRHEFTLNDTLFLNPGYSGRPRPGVARSVALLDFEDGRVSVRFIPLTDPAV